MDNNLRMISGHATAQMQKFEQIGTASSGKNFYGLIAVDGDAVINSITNADGTSGLSYFGTTATAYEGVFYPFSGKAIDLTSGKVVIYLGDQ